MATGMAANNADGKVLDPMNCLAKKNTKYAAETEEVYLSNLAGTSLSPNFQYFTNLTVLWLNNNRIARLENADACFRLQEIYIENNRLVSLAFVRSFKFLRALLASNNQIQNLDKQLEMLTRNSFLKKLDLFDNPIADEPDYRLRMIYHVPQVGLLDRRSVTLPDRQRAEEIVPNMDKVSASQPVKEKKKAFTSKTERDCFRTARDIRTQRVEAVERALISKTFTTHLSLSTPFPRNKANLANNEKWSSPVMILHHEMKTPTPWEKQEMMACINELAGKDVLTKDDVAKLSQQLHKEGIEQVGRVLCKADVFAPIAGTSTESTMSWKTNKKDGTASNKKLHPLESLMLDPEATMPLTEVVSYLLSLDWSRLDDEILDDRIKQHHDRARLADLQGDQELMIKCRDAMVRLDGIKTRKKDVGLIAKTEERGILRKTRSDVFSQSFLRPSRGIDEAGKTLVQVNHQRRSTQLCV